MIRRTLRWMLGLVGALCVLLALAIMAARVLLLQVPERRAELQAWVNRATGLDLRLTNLSARWGRGGPEIYATDVAVYAPNGGPRLARAQAVSIGSDIKRMLLRGDWKSGRVRLIGPEVRVVRTAQGLALEGAPRLPARAPGPVMNSDALPSGSLDVVDGRIVLIDARPGARPEAVVKLQGLRLKLLRDQDVLRFAGDLALPRRMGGTLEFSGAVRGRLDDPGRLTWQLSLAGRRLVLTPWREFLDGRWRALNPRGELSALDLTVAAGAQPLEFTVGAHFAGLGIDPLERIPGLSGLNGTLTANERAGEVRLSARDFVFEMPYRFREPITAALQGAVRWSLEEAPPAPATAQEVSASAPTETAEVGPVWHLESRQFRVVSPHAQASGDVELWLPRAGGPRRLDLRARFTDAVLAEGWRYLPIDRVRNPKTLAWLDAAFLSGRAREGELVLVGPTHKFPFREGEGEFRVTAAVEGLDLHYGPGWPDLTDLTVDVEFRNQGLNAQLESGSLHGLRLAPGGRVEIRDLREAELTVAGRAQGDLKAALDYLQTSPLGPTLGDTFLKLRGAGPVQAELELFLPLKRRAERTFAVTADFGAGGARNRLALEGTEHELRLLRGQLTIGDTQWRSHGLKGRYLGGPLALEFRPELDRRGRTIANLISVQAQTPAAALGRALKTPATVALGGVVDWRATARLPRRVADGAGGDATLRLHSTLTTAAIRLPAPLDKPLGESRPLELELSWPPAPTQTQESARARQGGSPVGSQAPPRAAGARITYGALLRGELGFDRAPQPNAEEPRWRLARGALRLGGAAPTRLPDTGLTIDGTVQQLDLAGWLALRGAGEGRRRLAEDLRSIELAVGELKLHGFRLPQVQGRLSAQSGFWAVELSGPKSRGTVRVPYDLQGSEPLLIDMQVLDLGEPRPGSDDATPDAAGRRPDPTRWPAVQLSIGEFAAWNKRFGAVQAELARTPAGLELKLLSARGPSFKLGGTGSWTVSPQGQRGRLSLSLESSDVLDTLQQLGYGGSLTGERGQAVLDLNWPGPPDGQLLARLSGSMSVEVDKGRLLGVEPGAGRVFGLMSVATLRRRLALDFSDLTDKGLAFDVIRGDFTLRAGDAFTSNLLLRGPVAEIGIVGRTGLAARDYDQTAVVTGNLGQSLPVAGALAGGPAVGAALLVFSQIFKQPLKGIARGYYRITGPWENPTVERVEAEAVKKATESKQAQGRDPG